MKGVIKQYLRGVLESICFQTHCALDGKWKFNVTVITTLYVLFNLFHPLSPIIALSKYTWYTQA